MQVEGRSGGPIAAIALAALLAPAAPVAAVDAPTARVTAVQGSATAGDRALSQRASVEAGEAIETGAESHCAVLLEEDTLAELCGHTRVALERREGRRIVRVDAGEARIAADPASGERLEIHTPVAIATLLGTVVYVTVDPDTGETTFTSGDHEVAVRNRDAGVAGETRIAGGDSTTVARGRAPSERVRRRLETVGACLVDLRQLARLESSAHHEARVTSEVTKSDMDVAELPRVGAPGGPPTPPGGEPEPPSSEVDLILPTDTNELPTPPPGPGPDLGFDDFF